MVSIKKNRFWLYPVCIVICEFVGLLAGFATATNIQTWYPTLLKPDFTPPNWLFAPVWTGLYAIMGIAWAHVWRKNCQLGTHVLFLAQLILNGAWSFVFFNFHALTGSVVIIVALWVLVLLTCIRFFKISKWAGWLLVPYLLWLSYATALNLALWYLNGW